jgi:hypothetical protein
MLKACFLSAALILGTVGAVSTISVPQAQAGDRAVRGGLIGAGAGALIGGVATGRAGGAVAGAVVGGAAGAIIGNERDKRHRYNRRNVRRGGYYTARGNCYYRNNNGRVSRVSHRPCGY